MRELKIFHPNAKGTGWVLKISETSTNTLFQIFPQGPSKGGFPSFDWDAGVSFVAEWRDLAKVLMVFRGDCESLEDGKGVSYTSAMGWSKLMLRHVIEPVHCYVMEVYEKRDGTENRGIFRLSTAEALGLSMIIEGVLHHTLTGGEP